MCQRRQSCSRLTRSLSMVDAWLQQLYAEQSETKAIDMVYNHVDDLLCASDFAAVDDILHVVNVSKLPITVLLSILVVTLGARHALTHRALFCIVVHASLWRRDSLTRADKLMQGLW